MATARQKAQCVEWYFKSNSMVRVESNFRRSYPGRNAPTRKAINLWIKNFRHTGSVTTRKCLGRSNVSKEKLTRIKRLRSPKGAIPQGIQNSLSEQLKIQAPYVKIEEQDTSINKHEDADEANGMTSEEFVNIASIDEKLSVFKVKIENCQNDESMQFANTISESAVDIKQEDFECEATNLVEDISLNINAPDKNDRVETIYIKSEPHNNEAEKTKQLIECEICHKHFTKFGIKHHVRSHGAFPCGICGSHCTSRAELLKHTRTHSERPFECELCHSTFTVERSLLKHRETHLDEAERERRFQCSLCDKRFYTKSNRDYHTMRHMAKSFTCGICGKQFATKFNLKSHLQLHSSEKRERSHKCHVCDKTYLTRTHLNDHMRNHTGEKPHKCDVCNKEFARRTDWLRHTKSMHLNSFTCELCGKRLSSRHTLNVHLKQQTCMRRKKVAPNLI